MRTRHHGDDGVVAVIVAVVTTAVLFGFGMLVVDVGALYAERRELQNAADSAAYAVAQNCASSGGCAAGGGFSSVAQTKANQNSNDATSEVDEVCGTGAGMPSCSSPPAVPSGANYVRVTTSTRTSGGGTLVPPVLARALISSYDGTTVRATATVAWGAPAGGRTLPLTFSGCEFSRLVPTGVPANPGAGTVQVLYHDGNSTDPCSATRSNSDAPGAFGWVDPDSGTAVCSATIVNGTLNTSTGNAVPNVAVCRDMFDVNKQTAAYPNRLAGASVLVPIFDETRTTGTGANIRYTITGFAEFYVTGWNFGGQYYYPNPRSAAPCNGSSTCIAGYFVRFVNLNATVGAGGTNYGAIAISLVG